MVSTRRYSRLSRSVGRWRFLGGVARELVALPGTLDDLKVWAAIGGPPILLAIGRVREWLMSEENVHLMLKTIGIGWPLAAFLVIRFRGAWRRAVAKERALDIGYARYVAVREDEVFGPSDFLDPSTSSASKTDTLRVPRYTGRRFIAIAAPAFLADPVKVDMAAQGINTFNSFVDIPGVFELAGMEYRAWRTRVPMKEVVSEEVFVIKQRLPPTR